MTRLVTILRESVGWVFRNPILLLIVLILVTYNELAGTESFIRTLDWTSAEAILAGVDRLVQTFLTPLGMLSVLIGMLISSTITMLTVGTSFAVFASRPRRFVEGLRMAFSKRMLFYFLFQTILFALGAVLSIACMRVVIQTFNLPGIIGAALIFLIGLSGYLLLFMISATASVIFAAQVSWYGRWHLTKTALRPRNLMRLASFYATRIGLEALVLVTALLLTAYLETPPIVTALIVLAIVTVPFTLIRTSGFLLKFDIFKEDVWFRSYFHAYYESARLIH